MPVKYTGNAQGLTGQYSLVVWENKIEPQALMLQAQWNGEGAVDWTALPYAQHPTQSHILTQLAALPNLGYTSAYLGKGAYYLFPGDARRLP